jgi:hypothetical protein
MRVFRAAVLRLTLTPTLSRFAGEGDFEPHASLANLEFRSPDCPGAVLGGHFLDRMFLLFSDFAHRFSAEEGGRWLEALRYFGVLK